MTEAAFIYIYVSAGLKKNSDKLNLTKQGHAEVAQKLVRAGANIDSETKAGDTPLRLAQGKVCLFIWYICMNSAGLDH